MYKYLLVVLELLVLEMQGGICLPATEKKLTDFIIGIGGISHLTMVKNVPTSIKMSFC